MENASEEELINDNKEWKKIIHDYRHEASTTFNKQIVYLSGGGLVLTIGFVKDIVKIETATSCWMLVFTWILLTSSLLLNLLSHKSTMKAMDLELNGMNEESDKIDAITNRYDQASVGTLITAFLLFIIFVAINIL